MAVSDPINTPEDFTARYGYSPQEYFNKVVAGDANPPDLPDLENQLTEAQKQKDATKGWETSGDPTTMANGAYWETQVGNILETINARLWHQNYARQFLAGVIKDYGPFLSTQGQVLMHSGWIDTTARPNV